MATQSQQGRDDGGGEWNVKSSRQQKRNKIASRQNTKSGNRANGGAPSSGKKRNRRRSGNKNPNAKPNVDAIVRAMKRDDAFKDKFKDHELRAVVVEMSLKTYNANDQRTRYELIEALEKRSQESLMDDAHSIQRIDSAPSHQLNGNGLGPRSGSKGVGNVSASSSSGRGHRYDDKEEETDSYDDEEDESASYDDDDDDDEEEDSRDATESDEYEDDDSETDQTRSSGSDRSEDEEYDHDDGGDSEQSDDYDRDQDEDMDPDDEDDHGEEAVEEKEKSPEPPDAEPSEAEDKQSASASPERSKKRKRRRKKKKKNRGDEAPPAPSKPPQDAASASPEDVGNGAAPKKAKKRDRKKNRITLATKLRDLNLLDPTTNAMVKSWVSALQHTQNQQFMSNFQRAKGMDHIVKHIVQQFCDLDMGLDATQRLRNSLLSLFNKMLCGSPEYHRWLLEQLIHLSHQISKHNTNSGSDLVQTISQQAESLVNAQCNPLNNGNEIAVDQDHFQKPSQLLHDGPCKTDPIIPMLEKLDPELDRLSELYHDLKKHDCRIRRKCPTSSEAFRTDYNEIRDTLTRNISKTAHMQREKDQEIEEMQRRKQRMDKDQSSQMQPFERQLENHRRRKYQLEGEKKRVQEELRKIEENLAGTDLYIKDTEQELSSITERFKPRMEELEAALQDSQFDLAQYSQETECYSALLNMVDQSYRRLDEWSKKQLDNTSSDRNGKEQDYIDHFKHYVKRMCDAKAKVMDRLQSIKETKAYYRNSDVKVREHYHQSLNMDPHIEHMEQLIKSDEAMNQNMEKAIYDSMEKAQKMVSPPLFSQFIQQISMDRAGNYIDLSRYKTQPMPRTTVSTQTNLNRQRHAPPRSVLPQQRVHPQYGHRAAAQMQGQSAVVQGVRRPHPQSQAMSQQQRVAPPRAMTQQQHAAPHRTVQQRQRQTLPRAPQHQQAMNGAVNHQQNRVNHQNLQNRANVAVHTAPRHQAMGQRAPQQMHSQAMGRKPARPPMPMNKGSQSGNQQMMQMMMNTAAGQQGQGMRGASKPPVPSSRGRGHTVNVHYNQQQAAAQNVESSQQVQGQQQQPPSQPAPQGQRRRAPMVNGQGNQVQRQQQYRQYE